MSNEVLRRRAAFIAHLRQLYRMPELRPVRLAQTVPVATVLPSMAVLNRLAHAEADRRMAADPKYAEQCARLDAMLAGMPSDPLLDILTND